MNVSINEFAINTGETVPVAGVDQQLSRFVNEVVSGGAMYGPIGPQLFAFL